jgi:hypothetical protein
MAIQTGENEQAMRKIMDMTRLIAVAILLLHFYFYGYGLFRDLSWHTPWTNKLLRQIAATGIFAVPIRSKLMALFFLILSLLGARGKKEEKHTIVTAMVYGSLGLLFYFLSNLIFYIGWLSRPAMMIYIAITTIGFLLILKGLSVLSRIIRNKLTNDDIFNQEGETFPQEERLLENDYSINLPSLYRWKKKIRSGWINIINPFRGIMVLGTPGSGKSYFVIRHIITQHIRKGFTMFVYDFKYDDLSIIAYNAWLKWKHTYTTPPLFYTVNFDDLSQSHRCNPLDPSSMTDITDAAESARTILMGLNREWIRRQGDFFVESPINFLTAIIWYLRKFKDGEFCTLPHVIEMMQLDYDRLFTLLRTEKEIEVLVNPFINAYLNDVMEQLEGQVAAAKVAMAKLSSPQLYYVLSGNDFNLDVNNPDDPKIVCMGNNPQKIQVYGAVVSLYVNRLVKLVNKKGKLKCSLIFDEYPTIFAPLDTVVATGRSNLVSTTVGVQSIEQLRRDYSREQAEVLINLFGNVIAGQCTGDTAKQLSERFGKIMQDRKSQTVNSADTSISYSRQLESAVPSSKIAALSSGEFVGMVADNPERKVNLKTFHCEIINDHKALQNEEKAYKNMGVIRTVNGNIIQRNYLQIKQDIENLVCLEMERLLNNPALTYLVIRKN